MCRELQNQVSLLKLRPEWSCDPDHMITQAVWPGAALRGFISAGICLILPSAVLGQSDSFISKSYSPVGVLHADRRRLLLLLLLLHVALSDADKDGHQEEQSQHAGADLCHFHVADHWGHLVDR